ncbi:MAG: T9SS type A sorting domain-containing protein [Saprospiraceae bacterium]|nr:T9SS type A sorting domain-containing protein [Saprospiraceae bacterium]
MNLVFAPQMGKPLFAQMFNAQGRVMPVSVTGLDTSLVKMNTSSVVPGLYFVQVRTSVGAFVRKVVIE